jgi:hypothetical protein
MMESESGDGEVKTWGESKDDEDGKTGDLQKFRAMQGTTLGVDSESISTEDSIGNRYLSRLSHCYCCSCLALLNNSYRGNKR